MMVRFKCYMDPLQLKKHNIKTNVRVEPLLTKLSGSTHEMLYCGISSGSSLFVKVPILGFPAFKELKAPKLSHHGQS